MPDPKTKIVVNCAGRTRSIVGAQTLIDIGVPNPVYALENGTQGWFLAGLQLDHGASRRYGETPAARDLDALRARAWTLAAARGVRPVSAGEVEGWRRNWLKESVYLVRAPLKAVELTLAMLLPITSSPRAKLRRALMPLLSEPMSAMVG